MTWGKFVIFGVITLVVSASIAESATAKTTIMGAARRQYFQAIKKNPNMSSDDRAKLRDQIYGNARQAHATKLMSEQLSNNRKSAQIRKAHSKGSESGKTGALAGQGKEKNAKPPKFDSRERAPREEVVLDGSNIQKEIEFIPKNKKPAK